MIFANMRGNWADFVGAVRADHHLLSRCDTKYGSGRRAPRSVAGDAVQRIGFQMLVAYRVMRYFSAVGAPLLPQVLSRSIRYLYGADIHWNAQFAPGVAIVHGMGICISGTARVASGVILFQGVTLGESIDPVTRIVGSPHVAADVHIGPGATLIGPITIGAGTKIMANCVVTESVPDGSLVEAPAPRIRPRSLLLTRRDKAQHRLSAAGQGAHEVTR